MIIWLPSYPRSGNTLLRTLLRQVFKLETYSKYNDQADLGADNRIASAVGHQRYEGSWANEFQRMRSSAKLHLVKTHEGPESDDRAIFIVRHGWSACISNQHYLRDFSKIEAPLSHVIAGIAGTFPSWGRMLDLWDPPNRPKTLLVRYEDIIESPQTIISELHAFLGVPVHAEWQNNFAAMQKLDPQFFRSGQTKIEEATFGPENAALFDSLHGDWMQRFGYTQGKFHSAGTCKSLRTFVECNPSALKLAAIAREQAEYIKVLETERASLSAQQHINSLKAQLDQLAAAAQQQFAHISVLEKERDRLAALVTQYSGDIAGLSSTAKTQTDYISVLEKERDRLAARETQLSGETAHYLKVMDEQLRYIQILETVRNQTASTKS